MELVTDIALYVSVVAFLTGFLITLISGSARAIKILLAILSLIFLLAIVAGFIFSRGLLIFLVTQLIVLILIFYFLIIAGAVAGGGVYSMRHKRKQKHLDENDLPDYLGLAEFAAKEGISEARVMSRIHSGYYLGGHYENTWYVHQSELSDSGKAQD